MPRTKLQREIEQPKRINSTPPFEQWPELIDTGTLISWGFTSYQALKILKAAGCITVIKPFFINRDALGRYFGK